MSVQDLLQGWVARGLADFPGLAVAGAIPLKQELVNQLIAEALAAAAGRSFPAAAPPDVAALLPLLKKVEVAATEGVITLHFEVRA
ncbi:MAG: hypothetical protein ABIX28_18095 [Vicinamibacterales bacterium]